ncbi:hypothetical protein M2323_001768 [Rhodoblastus acidophilus]|uniref:hypothetical protein n=1 Tax=Rhodoblastus acidophilus TaxID=1074 RepID=UPI002225412C|nr:hypothetical protein [Rhodoblastus acidophilus]MCW2283800.1 hypothetical protein [Rhodoblastus acidophilus]MCW2332851.1 hypothetical protein [Rhodoblastus acidophilus]
MNINVTTETESDEFLGRCTSRNGQSALFAVTHKKNNNGEFEPIPDPRKVFPKKGEAEMIGIDAINANIGDERIFNVRAHTQFRAQAENKIVHPRQLANYLYWPNVADSASARKQITHNPQAVGLHAGTWAIRFADDEIAVISLADNGCGQLGIPPEEAVAVPIYQYDAAAVVKRVGETDAGQQYVPVPEKQIRHANWQTDKDYLTTIIQAARRLEDDGGPGGKNTVATLLEFVRSTGTTPAGSISLIAPLDRLAAIDAIRSAEIFKLLELDKKLLDHVIDILKSDPKFQQLREEAAKQLAETEKPAIVERIEASIRTQIIGTAEAEARKIIENAKATSDQFEKDMLAEVDVKTDTYEKEKLALIARQLSSEEKKYAAALEELKGHQEKAATELQALEERLGLTVGELATAEQKKSEIMAEIERLSGAANSLRRSAIATPHPFRPAPKAGLPKRASPREWADSVAANPLLTCAGKEAMARFAALTIAGEVPVLTGADADDFIKIAARITCGGRVAALAADPTIITVDDLWVRAGSGTPTALGIALGEIIAEENSDPALAVISNPGRSASTHWLQPLAQLTKGGALKGKLRPAIIALQMDTEVEEAAQGCFQVDTAGTIEKASLPVAPLFFGDISNIQILTGPDAGLNAADVALAITEIAPKSLALGMRGAELLSAASLLMKEDDAKKFTKEFIAAVSPK